MLYIFDMGGVLVHAFDVMPEAARRMGMPEHELRSHAAPDLQALMAGVLSGPEFWSRFEARSGFKAADDYWSSLFAPEFDVAMEVFIRTLGQSDRVVCGSNTIDSHYDYLKAKGMYDCFDAVYVSNIMGLCKPDLEFWRAILKAEQTEPADAIFVDDMLENVLAARTLGIASFHFTGIDTLKAELALSPGQQAENASAGVPL